MISQIYRPDSSSPLIDVALYLHGRSLDPTQATSMLGVNPSKTRFTGESWRTSTNTEVVTKVGFWKLDARAESLSLPDQISWLRQKLESAKCSPAEIPGVETVKLTVFVALGSNAEGAVDYESEFTVEDLAWLSSIKATVSLSFIYTAKEKGKGKNG